MVNNIINPSLAEQEFILELSEIDLRFSNWFNGNKDSLGNPDSIHNHYFLAYGPNYGMKFGFMPDSHLPEFIRDNCFLIFRERFLNEKLE